MMKRKIYSAIVSFLIGCLIGLPIVIATLHFTKDKPDKDILEGYVPEVMTETEVNNVIVTYGGR